MRKVAVIDSGSANLNSICKALARVSLDFFTTDDPAAVAGADGLIFPGVGAFGHAMTLLRRKGLAAVLLEYIDTGKPVLGICLGLQLLFSSGEEASSSEGPLPAGLNVIPGRVRRFPGGLPVPHVGWNRASPTRAHPLFDGFTGAAYFYFTHSYYTEPEDPAHALALTEYGRPFVSAVARDNLTGVQFHPEKSGAAGLRLLSNFGKIIADPTLSP